MRWEEYFKQLLNVINDNDNYYESKGEHVNDSDEESKSREE